jgi:CDP-glycerol glycerophosphotransferase (TagB/SpsB family)
LEETPFLVAYNENDLFNNIMNFDKDVYKHKVEAFLQDKEAVDDGKSSERIVDEICKLLKI